MGAGLTDREPDARFSLAAERTYLAWVRTALALIAGGLAASQLLDQDLPGARWAIALPLVGLGLALAATSHGRWRAVDRAIRAGDPLPRTPLPAILSVGLTLVALAAAVLTVVDLL